MVTSRAFRHLDPICRSQMAAKRERRPNRESIGAPCANPTAGEPAQPPGHVGGPGTSPVGATQVRPCPRGDYVGELGGFASTREFAAAMA